ncbi:MAG: metallophosphoesterase [Actinomycetota bacterium]
MSTKIIVDLHGAVDALRDEIRPDDTLLLLGDLINLIDYRDMQGILVDVFGRDTVAEIIGLRLKGRFNEAKEVMAKRREGQEAEIAIKWTGAVNDAYAQVFEVLPDRTLAILGNADYPANFGQLAPANVEMVDGKVVELEGLRVGFVGGGLPTAMGIAGEITVEEFNAKIDAIAEVDVLCSHMPPEIPALVTDTLAGGSGGSTYMVDFIKRTQPQKVFFGHIHQPLVSSMHLGRTHLVNAGYFRRTHRALAL